MSNLRELFETATATPPPSRLSIEDVYAATRARRRRRHLWSGLAAATATMAVAVGGIALVADYATHPPAGPGLPGSLVWAGRGDATHLYAVRNDCGRAPSAHPAPDPACSVLLASSDAGATWTSRGTGAYPPRILGPQSLLRSRGLAATTPAPTDLALLFELSTDGGETWVPMPAHGPVVDAVPPGGTLLEFGQVLMAFDPAQGRLRKLAQQPALKRSFGSIVAAGTTIWLSGYNLVTLHPAVAVSHDAGASWILRDMPGTAPNPQPTLSNGELDPNAGFSGHPAQLIAGGGDTAYLTIWDGSSPPAAARLPGVPENLARLRTYRTTDGGLTWQAVAAGSTTPSYGSGWLTADGRIVVALPNSPPGGTTASYVYAVSTDGITYTPAVPPGLPAQLNAIYGLDGTSGIALTGQDIYITDDGWTWRRA